MAFIPAAADQHAAAVAMVTANVHAPVTIRAGNSSSRPSVSSATPRAYSLRSIRSDAGGTTDLRTVFVDFE